MFLLFVPKCPETRDPVMHKHPQICKHRHTPHRRSQGVASQTPTSAAAGWFDCSIALPPAAHTQKQICSQNH